jgi:hypothetical protein
VHGACLSQILISKFCPKLLNWLRISVTWLHLISCMPLHTYFPALRAYFLCRSLIFSIAFPNVNAYHYLLHDVIYPINDLHVAVSCCNLFPAWAQKISYMDEINFLHRWKKSILLHPAHNCCAQQLGRSAQNKLVHPPLVQPTRTHIIDPVQTQWWYTRVE